MSVGFRGPSENSLVEPFANPSEPDAAAESLTSPTLLSRLRNDPGDSRGWDEFVQRYGGRIVGWCRRWGLQEADATDVAQNVLLELSQQMQRFRYDPGGRFRAWLKTVTRRAWYDFSQRRKRREFQADGDDWWETLESEQAQDDLLQRLEDECNRELLEAAMQNVQSRVAESTWQAFRLTEFDGKSADEAAEQLGMNRGAVYVARGRVQKMIVEEVERLDRIHDA
jgi:RNA polymerase sigma factor (sigma-70 family)